MYFCNVKLCGYTNIHCNMEFKRQNSIEKLVAYKHSHLVKVVTGLRRVGKSYLLLKLYRDLLYNPKYRDYVKFQTTVHDEINYIVKKERIT